MEAHFKHYEIYDIIQAVENIDIGEALALLRGEFDARRSALAVIDPQ